MSYVTDQMRAALADHRLKQVCNSNGVRAFRMAKPDGGGPVVELVFLPDRTIITGDVYHPFDDNGRVSRQGYTLERFLSLPSDDPRWRLDFRNGMVTVEPQIPDVLHAIQQRFAELWRERAARIEAIVAGWGWVQSDITDAWFLEPGGECGSGATIFSDGTWQTSPRGERGRAASVEAAKTAARAAVLRQAKEHPELWHCGSVEG